MKYLVFKYNSRPQKKVNLIKKISKKILEIIFPIANPDFDSKIDDVVFWLLEFDEDLDYPIREIGLDQNKNVVLKMPYRENYGYWTDNELTYQDFIKRFSATPIEKILFEKKMERIF